MFVTGVPKLHVRNVMDEVMKYVTNAEVLEHAADVADLDWLNAQIAMVTVR